MMEGGGNAEAVNIDKHRMLSILLHSSYLLF